MVEHTLKPIYNKDSKILILGTMPSVKSRELSSYYAHPQNRFWKILEKIIEVKITDKEDFLLNNKIALWDVIASCEIKGSSDNTIKNVKLNKIEDLIKNTNIKYIFCTGKLAFKLYTKNILPKTKIEAIYLSSPSPANRRVKFEDIVKEYKIIKEKLKEE